jgi:hypothetical protein
MKSTFWRSAWVVASITSLTAAVGVRADIVYDNSTYYKDKWLYSGSEIGDEVILAGTGRSLTNFDFEYYAVNLSSTAEARVRLYNNDGPLTPAGFKTPGTVLFDSGFFPVTSPGNADNRATLIFNQAALTDPSNTTPLSQNVPGEFTWAVQFDNPSPAAGEQFGLVVYSPPTVGTNFTDYWQRDGADWLLLTNSFGAIDFGARFYAVPEPTSFALALFGAVGLAGWLWKRRRVR